MTTNHQLCPLFFFFSLFVRVIAEAKTNGFFLYDALFYSRESDVEILLSFNCVMLIFLKKQQALRHIEYDRKKGKCFFYDVYMTSLLIAKRKVVLHDKIANISKQVISSHQHHIPF